MSFVEGVYSSNKGRSLLSKEGEENKEGRGDEAKGGGAAGEGRVAGDVGEGTLEGGAAGASAHVEGGLGAVSIGATAVEGALLDV